MSKATDLFDKLFGRHVTNIPVNNSVKMQTPISGVAGQLPPGGQFGVMAQQPIQNQIYVGSGSGGSGGGGGGGGLIGGPNNYAKLVSGPITIKPDVDASLTGIHYFAPIPFNGRDDANCEAFYGDSFKMDDELYPTDFDLSEGKNEFHFLVWKSIWGDTIRDYGFVMRRPKLETLLVFSTRESRNAFVSWFEEYRDRYPDRNTTEWRVPHIRQGRTGGCFADRKEFNESEVVQVWAWIIGHCSGSAAFLPNFILFDNENDAVAYRLRWG